jgi:hypothetical protein
MTRKDNKVKMRQDTNFKDPPRLPQDNIKQYRQDKISTHDNNTGQAMKEQKEQETDVSES